MHQESAYVSNRANQILQQMRQVIVGKDQQMAWFLAAVLSGGHILLEDIPGVGKTTMAVGFSKVLGLRYNRVQFTPDVLPSDITGFTIPDAAGNMTYKPGAVLCNLFLADELNRATSRTQSALLEAMEENQVTVDGVSHPLPQPFIVIATQNPTGAAGTQLLPDSQMDRFALRMSLGYPKPSDEISMVMRRQGHNPMQNLTPLMDAQELIALRQIVAATHVSENIVRYIVALVNATRSHPNVLQGASPRATLCLTDMAKALAQLSGRDYVVPADVQQVFRMCIPHRILLQSRAEAAGITQETVLTDILRQITPPATK